MRRVGGAEPEGFGDWLGSQMARCGFKSNIDLETATGIGNTTISRWRNGTMAPSVEQLRKLEDPLRTPLLELLVRAGVLSRDEAKVSTEALQARTAVIIADVAEAIRQDAGLIEEARSHLLNQYDLLRRLTPQPSLSEARGKQGRRRSAGTEDQELRAVARGGNPEDRAEVSRMARRVREQHEREGKGKKE